MQKINKFGLSLGVVSSLVLSAVVGLVPAQAAIETSAVISPVGAGPETQNSIVQTETFELRLRYGTGVVGVNGTQGTVTNPSIQIVSDSTSAVIVLNADADGNFSSGATHTVLSSDSATVATDGYAAITSASPYVSLGLVGLTSVSPAVKLTVTPFMDIDGVGGLTSGDSVGTPYEVNFVPWSTLGATLTLGSAVAHDQGITASMAVTAGSIRWSQLDGVFGVKFSTTQDTETNGATWSMQATGVATPSTYKLTGAELQTGNYSQSASVLTSPLTTSGAVQSYSATLIYAASLASATADASGLGGRVLVATVSNGVTSKTITGVTISPVAGDNVEQTSAGAADARINSAFVINAYPHSTAATVSMAVASTVTVSAVGSAIEFGADKGVILNGTTYTSSGDLAKAGFTLAAGTTTFTASTFGQDYDSSADTLALVISSQLQTATLTLTFKTPTYAVVYTPGSVSSPAGVAKSFTVSVKDNWSKLSTRTDQKIAASVVLGGSTSETVSAAVVAGVATLAVSPTPATRTGSAVVTFTLQTFNQDTQKYDNGTTDTADWNVYDSADAFVSRTASVSASISYGVALSYSPTVAVTVANSSSAVVVSAPGLIIRDADDTSETASGTLTIQATGKAVNVQFAGTKTGTYTVTFTNGTATTTSLVVFEDAPSDLGTQIVWDTTTIVAGATRVITGTVLDANGNPVDTTAKGETVGDSVGSASIVVTYYGTAGIVVGSMPTETDADGKFRISVLTAAADKGTMTLTATYLPQGASTAAADKVTSINSINVGAAAGSSAGSSADQKLTIGTFNGYIAIYAKGYEGQKLSYKVAGKWGSVASLKAFERVVRKTGAGYEINVDLYIDGVKVKSETVTTK